MKLKFQTKISKIILITIPILTLGLFWFVLQTNAFSGPPGNPGAYTGGALKFNSATGNFGIGANPVSDTRLLIKADSPVTGLRVVDTSGFDILSVGPDYVKVGNPPATSSDFYCEMCEFPDPGLIVNGIRASSSYFDNLYTNNARIIGNIIGATNSSIYGFDLISVNTISSTFSAKNISNGVFGTGDYAFGDGSRVGVSYSDNTNINATLDVNGTGYFSGNVGIGMTNPTDPGSLNIYSSNVWLSGFNKGIRLQGNSAIEFGGSSGGTLYGMGVTSNRLFIFNTTSESNPSGNANFYNLVLNSNGVGIGLTSPAATLHVSGTLKISGPNSGFQFVTSTAAAGRVLTSADTSGNAYWADPAGISAGSSGDTPRYNGTSWIASSLLYNNGNFIGVSTTVASADNLTLLRVGSGGYFQFDKTFSGAPASGDCTAQTTGRITLDTSVQSYLYVCVNGTWKALKLLN